MLIKDTIEYELPFLYSYFSVADAINWCEQYNSKFAFINDENKILIGYVSLAELYELDDSLTISTIELHEFKYRIFETQHVFELLKICSTLDSYILPILSLQNKIIGFCNPEKILQQYLENNPLSDEGGTIILSVNSNDYSLSEISKIVESNGATILNVTLNFNTQTQKIEVTLKINRTDLKNIEATFERYQYQIINVFHQSEYDSQIRDRIDNLLKYLQV